MGRKMGVLVDRTPKCHCKLAGEGVEYSWGCAKNTYRRVPLKNKRGKENFRKVVRQCLSREEVLTTERIRTFSRRARAYICAYYSLWCERKQQQLSNGGGTNQTIQFCNCSDPVSVEKLMKRFKTHQCALDFDHAFCRAVVIDLTQVDDEVQQGRSVTTTTTTTTTTLWSQRSPK